MKHSAGGKHKQPTVPSDKMDSRWRKRFANSPTAYIRNPAVCQDTISRIGLMPNSVCKGEAMARASCQSKTCSTMSHFTGDGLEKDRNLIQSVHRSDEEAFAVLVGQLHPSMVQMALRYVADRDAAEDVAQETWLAVITGIHRFEGRSSLKTWIFGILIHKAKDRGVHEKRHLTFSAIKSYDDDIDKAIDPSDFLPSGQWAGRWASSVQPWDNQTPERLLASQQAVNLMIKAIEALPKTLRDVLILRSIEGFETKEVCQTLKITEANLYVRLHRARVGMRTAIETFRRSGFSPAPFFDAGLSDGLHI